MKVACIQFAPILGDTSRNLEVVRRLVAEAAADLVVLPELALTGYFFKTRDEIAKLAEPIDGKPSEAFSNLARSSGKAIVTGFLEASGGSYYNSALAFDHQGHLAGHYRKLHLFYYETQVFSRGDLGFPVFNLATPAGPAKVGMLICYDWRFPEAARAIALHGAELIAMPSNIVTTTGMLHTTLRTRAFENKVALAFADRIGSESNDGETLHFRGESALIAMNGDVLVQASSSNKEIIIADIDLSTTRGKAINTFNDIFADRPKNGYGL